MRDLAVARASLFPLGAPQERVAQFPAAARAPRRAAARRDARASADAHAARARRRRAPPPARVTGARRARSASGRGALHVGAGHPRQPDRRARSASARSRTTSGSPSRPTRSTRRSGSRTSSRTCSAKACSRRRSSRSTRGCSRRATSEEATRTAGAVAALLALVDVGARAPRRARDAAAHRRSSRPGFDGREARAHDRARAHPLPGRGAARHLARGASGVLNSHRRFLLSYVAPVAWNVVMIAALLVAGGRADPARLAICGGRRARWPGARSSSSCSCRRCSASCRASRRRSTSARRRVRTVLRELPPGVRRARRRADQRVRRHADRELPAGRRGRGARRARRCSTRCR